MFKRGTSPSFKAFPPLLVKERGIQGVRLEIGKIMVGCKFAGDNGSCCKWLCF